jgi:hypothetical protein
MLLNISHEMTQKSTTNVEYIRVRGISYDDT